MSFFTGDTLTDTFVPLDEDVLDDGTAASAVVHAPGHNPVTALAEIDEGAERVQVTWPEGLTLDTPGVGRIVIRLTYPGETRTVAVHRIVIEELDGWYTLYEAREDWEQAPRHDHKLYELLATAREQCLEYDPLAEGGPVPDRHRQAQLMQARNLWNAARVDPANGGIDGESFIITPHPLDWTIKQILRPQRGGLITGTEDDDDE